jgi:hypothetical protein
VKLPTSVTQRLQIEQAAGRATSESVERCLTMAIEIDGPADEMLWRSRLIGLVAKRPALRSVFVSADTHVVTDGGEPSLVRVPVTEDADVDGWSLAHAFARQEAARPFGVDESPLLRASLFSVADRHLLLVNADPRVCDAWSANLLVEDLLGGPDAAEPDRYVEVWQTRLAWVTGERGMAAVQRQRARVAGAWHRWPVPDLGKPAADATEEIVDLADATSLALRERVRRTKGSLLAVGAVALAFATVADPVVPLALRSTVAARSTVAEERVVGRFSNDVVLVLPPPAGTLAEHLRAVRGDIFAALSDQCAPYELVRSAMTVESEGLSFGLLFLPANLSGGDQTAARVGRAVASRAAVSICPTGADLDMFMVENPPAGANGDRPLLRLGVADRRGRVGATGAGLILDRWSAAMELLACLDWDRASARDIVARLRDGGEALLPRPRKEINSRAG